MSSIAIVGLTCICHCQTVSQMFGQACMLDPPFKGARSAICILFHILQIPGEPHRHNDVSLNREFLGIIRILSIPRKGSLTEHLELSAAAFCWILYTNEPAAACKPERNLYQTPFQMNQLGAAANSLATNNKACM